MRSSIGVKAGFLFLTALSTLCLAQDKSVGGLWDARIQYDDFQIPFPIEIKQLGSDASAAFFNGDERVTSTSGRISGTRLDLNFDHYATRLTATIEGGTIKGTYGGPKFGFHDFVAERHVATAAVHEKAPNIDGVWDLPYESPKGEHAWQLIVKQDANQVSAAILRVDGDTGALRGEFRNGKFELNHFDGARASILEIVPKPDGTLDVEFKGFHNPAKHFNAVRLEEAVAKGLPTPTDPNQHTRLKDPNEPLHFNFPDLKGNSVSESDARFKNKVLIVNVTGSWCPNCHDEAPFLEALYRKYQSQGLEIVALDFEEPEQRKDPARLQAFIKKYGITYTYLLAGEPSELQEKIPQAVNLNSWPTTFLVGRDGRVRSIHAGFAAAASGSYHTALKNEVAQRIESLLTEDVRASR
jgi:thiol-disulfide isomerase/thioredoxin